MSGMEIAGLVLASIPLVVTALEHYSDGMSTFERWWRYKREVNRVVRLLVAEQALFQGTCEKLLNAVVTPTELERLIELPGGAQWKDSNLDESLRRHLGRSYDSYMSCVEDMDAALKDLEARLELDVNGKPTWVDDSSFKSQMKRIQIIFSRGVYQEALKRLEKNNSILAGLTAQNLELEPIRRRRQMPITKLKYYQQHLVNLYNAIRPCWICGCPTQHYTLLRLDARLYEPATQDKETMPKATVSKDELYFSVVFSTDDENTPVTTRWSWQETCIRPILQGTEQCNMSKREPKAKVSGARHQQPNAEQKNLEAVPSATRKGVKFADEASEPSVTCTSVLTPNAVPAIQLPPRIYNLCEALQAYQAAGISTSNDNYIGYLQCQKQNDLEVRATRRIIVKDARHRQDVASLKQLVPKRDNFAFLVLSRAERLFLAVTVASAVLQLHHTPWLRERWNLDDILVHVNNADDLGRRIYLSKAFPEPLDPRITKENENHPGMGRVNIVTEWATAKRMMSKVVAEAGNRYGDAVRRCIYCEFDSRDTNLNNERFREAVHQGVVAPLGEVFSDFNQPYEIVGRAF
ncbi:hypothetical protein EPUS_05492 [Endocarpon pusillum Z07020]|uniref:Fungal N-terminal domain-containing protein n=1 Tax=Endocarpon pusillum (strain Z07020 / HMAS-L-300199) TaxID=1263415 RepID=U1GD08_ENDPU|nr:uncharacterized protein EPUS_05492 [Endocarpon pusillum Z07020]ERF69948.1 hypothetical protein EPUS_05492 [Endocarpon pusillum Z07020]